MKSIPDGIYSMWNTFQEYYFRRLFIVGICFSVTRTIFSFFAYSIACLVNPRLLIKMSFLVFSENSDLAIFAENFSNSL